MLVGRCSSELSSHKLQGKLKKSQPPSGAPRTDLSRDTALGRGVEEPVLSVAEEPVLSVAEGTPRALILLTPLAPFQPPKPAPGGTRHGLSPGPLDAPSRISNPSNLWAGTPVRKNASSHLHASPERAYLLEQTISAGSGLSRDRALGGSCRLFSAFRASEG
jgi:hypothetical protein